MASRNVLRTYRIPGVLFKNPTNCDGGIDSSGEFAATMGTRLGIHENISCSIALTKIPLKSKTKGMDFDDLETYRAASIACFLRDMDEDAYVSIFGSTAFVTTTASTEGLLTLNGRECGTFMSANSFKLLLAPRDPEVFPGVLFYNAIATIEPTPSEWGLDKSWGDIVVFKALPDATNRFIQKGRLQDFTL